MRAEWEQEELIGAWTLVEADWELIANKAGATRLGFSVMLKFCSNGRFRLDMESRLDLGIAA